MLKKRTAQKLKAATLLFAQHTNDSRFPHGVIYTLNNGRNLTQKQFSEANAIGYFVPVYDGLLPDVTQTYEVRHG